MPFASPDFILRGTGLVTITVNRAIGCAGS